MNPYHISYGSQRITIKSLAERLGIPTHGHTRMSNGKSRKYALGIVDIRTCILERCYGPDQGKVNFSTASALDAYLTERAATYTGALGPALRYSQLCIRKSYDYKSEAAEVFRKSQGLKIATQMKRLDDVETLLRIGEQWQRAANEIHDLIETHGIDAANALIREMHAATHASNELRFALIVSGCE